MKLEKSMIENIKAGADIHSGDGGYSIGTQEKYEEFAKARNQPHPIMKLAIEARLGPALLLRSWGTIDALTDSEQEELKQIEEFANLIVKKCCEIADEVERADVPTLASKFIKAHFGVTE